MSNPRKLHVGKNKFEKAAYGNMLKTQQAEDPTFELQETESTNSVIIDETGQSSITKPALKQYAPPKNIPTRDILVAIIIFGLTTVLFLFGMSLNREMGVVSERNTQNRKITYEIKDEVKKIDKDVRDLKIDVEVLKRTEVPRKNHLSLKK